MAGSDRDVAFHPINKALRIPVLAASSDYLAMYGGVSSFHPGGANFCFVDGSVRFLPEDIDSWDLTNDDFDQMCHFDEPFLPEKTFQALSTRNGNEAIDGF